MNGFRRGTSPLLLSVPGRHEKFESLRSKTQHASHGRHDRSGDSGAPLTCHGPSSRDSKVYFKTMLREKNSLDTEIVQLFAGLYYMGDTINLPEYAYTHTWNVGVYNLILNKPRRCATCAPPQPPNNITFGRTCSWLSPIGPALQRYTFSSVLSSVRFPITSL